MEVSFAMGMSFARGTGGGLAPAMEQARAAFDVEGETTRLKDLIETKQGAGSVGARAAAERLLHGSPPDHAFCMMMLSATRTPLAKRARRKEAETIWL